MANTSLESEASIMNEIYAIIYPIPKRFTSRLFDSPRLVFLKYTPHETISNNLKDCKKLLFYESHGGKKVIGEGKIERIELLNLEELLKKYEDDLFLTEEELYSYSDGREKKPLVFILKNLKEFNKKVKLNERITMGGKLITKEKYNKLFC